MWHDPRPGGATLARGTTIGEWVVEDAASGGWRCHHVDSPFRRAIARRVPGPDAEARAGAWARVSHPSLAQVVGVGQVGGEWFVLAEIVAGTPLDTFLAERPGPLGLRPALDVALQVCDALRSLHEGGLGHGDLRPSTVILGPDGRVRLAAPAPAPSAPDPYAAPEGGSGPEADRFAVGAVLALLTAGAPDGAPTHPDLAAVAAECRAPEPTARPPAEVVARRLRAVRDAQVTLESVFATTAPRAEGAGPVLPTRIGRYAIVRELGRGGVGVVYEANDPELRRKVALKVLLAGPFARSREIARFRQEAQAVARLDHEGIVKILDTGSQGDSAWFAMEFVDGPTLVEVVRSRGPLPWRDALRLVAGVARALDHAHRAGLLHRDVKPHNVLLEGDDPAVARPKLADFGLALAADTEATRLTGTGQVLGTPVYMAPEQATGDFAALGPATDVYGLGVTLYEALTARVPFEGATPLQLVGRILRGNPPPPTLHVPTLPRPVELVCLQAIRLEPRERYASAAAFADDLERCLRGEPPTAAEPTIVERARGWVRGHREALGRVGLAGSAALLALGAAVAFGSWSAERAAAEAEALAEGAWTSTRERMRATDAAGAEALFRAFAARPEHAGTRALVRAWWDRAAEQRDDARISSLASAYASARDPADQETALRRLAIEARAQRRHAILTPVLETLARRGVAPAEDPELRGALRDALFMQHRLAEAAAVTAGDPADTLVAALVGVTPTDQRGAWAEGWPGGGILLHDAAHARIVGLAPDLPTVVDLAVPGGIDDRYATPFALDGESWLFWRPAGKDGSVIARFDAAGAPLDVWRWPALRFAAAAADLDGVAGPELYVGAKRGLHRLRRADDGGWTVDRPSPETDAANSEVGGLVAYGDGIAMASAEWSAYDVRALTPDGERLRLAARRKLGAVWGLVATPEGTLLACKRDDHPSAKVMPPDRPEGVRLGLWELTPDGAGSFDAVLRAPGYCVREPAVGDFDGDGDTDVALAEPEATRLLARGPDGAFTPITLPGMFLVGAFPLDADPALEILVSDVTGRVAVLGAGEAALPPRDAPGVEREPVPEDADAVVAATWSRADDLVYAGQLREAAAALRELADLRYGGPLGLAALRRAAALWEASGDLPSADRAWRDADRAGAPEAIERRARMHRDAQDDASELEALLELEARGALPPAWAGERRRLEGLRAAPVTTLVFDGPLDPRWQIVDPLAVRRESGGLRIETHAPGVLARLPLSDGPGWLGVAVDFELERSEWGSWLVVQVESERGGRLGVAVSTGGGGWLLHRDVYCRGVGFPYGTDWLPTDARALSLAASLQPDGVARCALPPGRDLESGRGVPLAPPGPGPWDLVLRAEGQPGASTVGVLREVRLTGVAPTGDVPERTGVLAFADGDPAARPDTPAGAIAAAAARGDRRALEAALADAPATVRQGALAHLLHARLEVAGPILRDVLGDGFPAAVAAAWDVPILTHAPTDEDVARLLLPAAEGSERATPATVAERDALAALLSWRGTAEARRGHVGVAETSLRRALALQQDPAFGPIADLGAAALVNSAHLTLAGLRGAAGDLDGAFALLDEAVAHGACREVVRDEIAVRPDLAPLRADPRWAAWAGVPLPD